MFYDNKGVKTSAFLYHFMFLSIPSFLPVFLFLFFSLDNPYFNIKEGFYIFSQWFCGLALFIYNELYFYSNKTKAYDIVYFLLPALKLLSSFFFYWLEIKKNKEVARIIDTIVVIVNIFFSMTLFMAS